MNDCPICGSNMGCPTCLPELPLALVNVAYSPVEEDRLTLDESISILLDVGIAEA